MEKVSIPWLKRLLEKGGSPLLDQIFTSAEQAYCSPKRMKFENYAARFAAKRAVLKMLGLGTKVSRQMRDVEILKCSTGKPYLAFSSALAARHLPKKARFEISLAHERTCGMALVYLVLPD